MSMELRGQPVANAMKIEITTKVNTWISQGIEPYVAVLLVEGDAASACYARAKGRIAEQLGVKYELVTLPCNVNEETVIQTIKKLNQNSSIHGIMLELPLPVHLDAARIIPTISALKDVDGLTPQNQYAVMTATPGLYPATPLACMRLIRHYGIELASAQVALIGCGKTVGMPLFHLLIQAGATVTACHVQTGDLRPHLQQAEIAFVAVGVPNLIQPDMVHSNLVIVDAGINELADGCIVGDVSATCQDVVQALSPTPGGVGPITTVQLFANLMQAMAMQQLDARMLVTVL